MTNISVYIQISEQRLLYLGSNFYSSRFASMFEAQYVFFYPLVYSEISSGIPFVDAVLESKAQL